MIIGNILSLFDAKEQLAHLGIEWDRIAVDTIKNDPNHYGIDQPPKEGIHQYFMRGNSDVGYYTALMGTLRVHDKPRQWSEENLASAKFYPKDAIHD